MPKSSLLQRAYSPSNFREQGHALIDLLADHLESNLNQEKDTFFPGRTPEEQLYYWRTYLDQGAPDQFFKEVLDQSIQLHHPHYMGHQVSVPAPFGALSGLVSDMLNNGMAVFEMGPAATAMERIVLQVFAKAIGWNIEADGVITSGGTLANLTALLAARTIQMPEQSWDNPTTESLAVMVSAEAHYCVDRAVRIMGWGANGVIKIPTDDQFRMRTDQLESYFEEARKAGKRVVAVIGSACSTATGSFDNLSEISAFCRSNNLWFHVDGAHGGASVFSKKYNSLVKGIEQADSIVMDFHKMAATPALATALLFKNGKDGFQTFAQQAEYLYSEEEYDWNNTGKRTFECTKLMMGMKVFGIIKQYGVAFFEAYVDACFDLGKSFADLVCQRKNLELLIEPDCNIVLFRTVFEGERAEERNARNRFIREQIINQRNFYIVQTMKDGAYYLRCTFMNSFATLKDLEELLNLVFYFSEIFSRPFE